MMNFLKSLYITGFVSYLLGASAYALIQLIRGTDPVLSWLGMALATAGPLAFFAWVFVCKPVRTEHHPVSYSIISGLGLAITMAMSWRHGDAAGMIHIWAGLALLSWIVYLRWYSPFKGRETRLLAPGMQLPAFSLQNIAGVAVNSVVFRGSPHVLLFYRGNWCPFCSAQITEIAQHYRELEASGATVVLISPQPLSEHHKLVKKFDLPLQFLRDPDNQAAKQLGILAPWGTPMGMQLLGYASDTVLPTVIICDARGTILYSDLTDNYRIRPEPAEFLQVLRTTSV